jgi:hypothetical protein
LQVTPELSAYLANFGITTTTYADVLDVSATGTPAPSTARCR